MGDFERVPEIPSLANGMINSELAFAYPNALHVIEVCTQKLIAVLGVEIFQVVGAGFQTRGCSDYVLLETGWAEFVVANNQLAEQVVTEHPVGDDQLYIFTAVSRAEFANLNNKT